MLPPNSASRGACVHLDEAGLVARDASAYGPDGDRMGRLPSPSRVQTNR